MLSAMAAALVSTVVLHPHSDVAALAATRLAQADSVLVVAVDRCRAGGCRAEITDDLVVHCHQRLAGNPLRLVGKPTCRTLRQEEFAARIVVTRHGGRVCARWARLPTDQRLPVVGECYAMGSLFPAKLRAWPDA